MTTSKLLFSSGFDGGVSLNAPSGGMQTLSGIDSGTGYAWPPNVWGGGAGRQLLGGSFNNQIQTVVGHTGATTQALYQSVTGASASDAQDPLLFTLTASASQEGDLYTSERIKFQPDLAHQLIPGQKPDGTWADWRASSNGRPAARGPITAATTASRSVSVNWTIVDHFGPNIGVNDPCDRRSPGKENGNVT
jgi:hypothetical protein